MNNTTRRFSVQERKLNVNLFPSQIKICKIPNMTRPTLKTE